MPSEKKTTEENQAQNETAGSDTVERLVMPDVPESKAWMVLGFAISIATFMLAFIFFYGYFFDRKNYFNRKALYDYLKKHPLPEPKKIIHFTSWTLPGGIEITDSGQCWYAYRDSKGRDNVICSFAGDIIDRYRNRKIYSLLKQA